MPTIEEMTQEENVSRETLEGTMPEMFPNKEMSQEVEQGKTIFEWINTTTGEGTINERLEHPLNFNNSEGMAQVIRGLEGFFEELNLAIVDILVGSYKIFKGTTNA